MAVIYGLVDADTLELRYIGQTQDHVGRARAHRRAYPDLRLVVLERDPLDLDEAERRWIRETRGQGAELLNQTVGGHGSWGSRTPEIRAKISAARKGQSLTLEHRVKIGAAARRRFVNPEARAKMSAAMMGHPVNCETRKKISVALTGRRWTGARARIFSDEHKDRIRFALISHYRGGV